MFLLSLLVFCIPIKATDFPGAKTAVSFVLPASGGSYYAYSIYNIGRINDTAAKEQYISRTQYEFDLTSIPLNATINSVSLTYSCYDGVSSAYAFKINEVESNSSPQTIYSGIYNGTLLFDNVPYNASYLSSGDLTTLVNSKKATYLYLGAMSKNEINTDTYKMLDLTLSISFSIPPTAVNITAKNNFEYGTIKVGVDATATQRNSPFPITPNTGQTVNLEAQNQPYGGSDRVWNNYMPIYQSNWQKQILPDPPSILSNSQNINYSFSASVGDNNSFYIAGLRKNYRIDQTHNSEFDGNQTQQNTMYIVEQNNGNITAPSTKPFNGKNYSFAYWTDGITGSTRNVTPTDNTTYTAFYKYPAHSSTSVGYDKDGQRKVVYGLGAYDVGVWKVYESSSNVWLEKDGVVVNGGAPVNILSDGPEAKSPSMDYVISSTWYTDIFVVYQQKTANGKYKIKLVKFNGSGQKIYTYDILTSTMDYATFDATPVISVTRNPDQANGKTKLNIVWRQKEESSYQNGLYFMPGMDNGTNITWYYLPPIKINSTDAQSSNPTMASYKSPRGVAFLYHLAWQQGTSKINYRAIADNWNGSGSGGVTETGNLEEPSYGDGYNLNTEPSIAVLNIGTNNDYGVYYYDTPKLVWKTEFESVNHIGKTHSGLKGRWQTFYKYYTCDDIPSANINASTNEQSYVIAWGEMGGLYNRLIQSTNLSTQMITGTQGKDIQISNYDYLEWGSVLLNVFNNAYNTNAPFAFQNYYLTNGLNKTNNFIAKEGRFGTIMKGDAEFYFGMGDVTANNNLINFIEVNDTLELATKELLNSYLITEPFEVNDNCSFTYSIIYGVKDSLSAFANLSNTDNISFKVELIDNTSNAVLGVFDQVIQCKSNIVAYENLSYQVNTAGIGNRTVSIRLVVDPNLNDAKYSLSKIFSDGAPISKSKINEVNWRGLNGLG